MKSIFDSIDISADGMISMAEFNTDFHKYINTDLNQLIREEQDKQYDNRAMGHQNMSDEQRKQLTDQTRLDMLKAERNTLKR